MSKYRTFIRLLKTPGKIIVPLGARGVFDRMPDDVYLKLAYRGEMGRKLNLKDPKTFNEKLQWLKLHDRRPLFHTLVDKYEVKKYVADIIGEQYIIPTIGIWDDVDSIPFDELPDQFVLKCTHDSGSVILCRDKTAFNVRAAKEKLNHALNRSIYRFGREWPYKDISPRIIAEQYLEHHSSDVADYKVHVFNGVPRFILVCRDRFKKSGLTEDFYTVDWVHMDVRRPHCPNADEPAEKPAQLEKMLELSKILSADMVFARIDFYVAGGRLYFGEITLFPMSGFSSFVPDKWDETFGSWLNLDPVRQMMSV